MQLFVNDLTVMDFSYLCAQRGMVGESWIVDVILDGELNEESMIQDFSKVKKNLKRLIDQYVDHKLLVPVESPCTTIHHVADSDIVQVNFERQRQGEQEGELCEHDGSIYLRCPDEAYAFVYAGEVDMQSVSQYLKDILATHLPENVDDITLLLRCEDIATPYYHYTHGLKKHDGNCQRIAHGHRSKITIYEGDEESTASELYWSTRWSDIYIGTQEDLVPVDALSLNGVSKDFEYAYCFAYEASQGRFELVIPKAESELVTTDSTVECLAQYVLEEQQRLEPGKSFTVVAYEGVGKGAIAKG
ncbi:6-carboxytetrahydropterin synthase [Alteromonas oceanisediminis]|uniref:6-carboxytetrahydropterin synthase n=1 Tax=Alteromonas oceanisediminis TaxID=2836180 RepID=UPI001BD96EA7|nr:6-carboxytetrahydropterin synthase [Alteromonas oceanisediminis]MBT0587196.1 6-carboxytetrahydropterin synthase [Alteromonas oceanisediminis]